MQPQIRLKELAAQLGLSVTTVSRALAGYADVSQDTQRRVREAAEASGYVASRIGRMLVSGRSNFVGMILPLRAGEVVDPFMGQFMAELAGRLAERGRDLFLAAVPPGRDDLETLKHMVDGLQADAVVVNRLTRDDPRVHYLLKRQVPFVSHGRVLSPGVVYPWLDTDGEGAFERLAGLLTGLGHRRIAAVVPDLPFTYAFFRRRGLERGLAAAGLSLDPELVVAGDPSDLMAAVAPIRRLLDRRPRPTALVCLTDRLAFAALDAVRQHGLRVPEDVSVTGFDDLPTSAHASPPLTTFSQRTAESASLIADMVVACVEHGMASVEPRLIEPTFVARASHGPAPPD